MKEFRIDLKTFLGLAMPNQYSQSKYQAGFWMITFGRKSPNLHNPYMVLIPKSLWFLMNQRTKLSMVTSYDILSNLRRGLTWDPLGIP